MRWCLTPVAINAAARNSHVCAHELSRQQAYANCACCSCMLQCMHAACIMPASMHHACCNCCTYKCTCACAEVDATSECSDGSGDHADDPAGPSVGAAAPQLARADPRAPAAPDRAADKHSRAALRAHMQKHSPLWQCQAAAVSGWTLPQAVLALQALADRHGWSSTSVGELCATISSMLPPDNIFPMAQHMLKPVLRDVLSADDMHTLQSHQCAKARCGRPYLATDGDAKACPRCSTPRYVLTQNGKEQPARTCSIYGVRAGCQAQLGDPEVAFARQRFDRATLLAPGGFAASWAGRMAVVRCLQLPEDTPAHVIDHHVEKLFLNPNLIVIDLCGDGQNPFNRTKHSVAFNGMRCACGRMHANCVHDTRSESCCTCTTCVARQAHPCALAVVPLLVVVATPMVLVLLACPTSGCNVLDACRLADVDRTQATKWHANEPLSTCAGPDEPDQRDVQRVIATEFAKYCPGPTGTLPAHDCHDCLCMHAQ